MNKNEQKRHFAKEVINLLGSLALLMFVCRLWPILFLVILGIFVAALRLLFLSAKRIKVLEPLDDSSQTDFIYENDRAEESPEEVYGRIQQQITEILLEDYPNVRWVWENKNAKADVLASQPVWILLNKAGGYRRALVTIVNQQVLDVTTDVVYLKPLRKLPDEEVTPEPPEELEPDEAEEVPEKVKPPVNYSLVAFQWVEDHILTLNEQCNEAIAQGQDTFLIPAEKLPEKEAWDCICEELLRNEIKGAQCYDGGIKIKIKQ